jgi:hypothetical protein
MAELAYQSSSSQVVDEERDIRVEDYLNDKLQNSTDLANIDALLEDVKAQQNLLQKQVDFPVISTEAAMSLISTSSKKQKGHLMRALKRRERTPTTFASELRRSSRSKPTSTAVCS